MLSCGAEGMRPHSRADWDCVCVARDDGGGACATQRLQTRSAASQSAHVPRWVLDDMLVEEVEALPLAVHVVGPYEVNKK